VLLTALILGLHAPSASRATGMISFEQDPSQSRDRLAAAWAAVDEDRKRQIQRYLLLDLGLSSTGVIRLIGVYRDGTSGTLFHFQQLEQLGTRLLWSVLVDPANLTARVLHHAQDERVSGDFTKIPSQPVDGSAAE
jgi:hypothetical protein